MEITTKIKVPTTEQVDSKSQEIFNQLKSNLGMVPNLYATIGYSSNALSSFLTFGENAGKETFTNKEIEAIKLAVSEANNCNYCKAAHTAIATMNGFSEEDTLELRNLTSEDSKLKALTTLSYEIASKAGHVSEKNKENFFDEGFNEKALIDLVAVIISVTFTNYVFGLTQVPIDFPIAKQL